MEARLVISTISESKAGEKLISTLLEEELIACGNLFPKGISLYRWKGKIEREEEHVMLLKTTAERASAMRNRLQELHPYDVPEIVEISPSEVSESYLKWITENVK